MTEAQNVLRAEVEFSDEPMEIESVDGLAEAIESVAESQNGPVFVECEDRFADYKVYWNSKTETVRFGAVVSGAVYEVPDSFTGNGETA